MAYKTTYHVRGHEIDPAYRLKQHYILGYFFDCFARYCTSLTLAAFDIQKEGKSWVISDIIIDFTGTVVPWNTEVETEVSFRSVRGMRIEVDFSVSYNGTEVASGTSRWVIIDEESRRPVPLPSLNEKIADEIAKDRESKNTPEDQHPAKVSYPPFSPVPPQKVFIREVRFSHIDFNNHLNSLQYFSMAIDSLEVPFLLSHYPKTLRAKFEREVYLKQKVSVMLGQEGLTTSHALLRKENNDDSGEELSAFRMEIEWEEIK